MQQTLDTALQAKVDAIVEEMAAREKIVVAFSGGVDSTVVAALAHRAVGEHAAAVTAVSETLAGRELEEAKALAAEIGIEHRLVEFSELDDPRFRQNTPSRCFFCQSMRFDQLGTIAETLDCTTLASGTNFSDVGDHRPGLEAMKQRRVYQPLLDHEIDKDGVRQIARWLGLSVWDKPAMACLSSRIPHGLEVTDERLRRIERAEEALHEHGFEQFRVRDHDGLARIELAAAEIDRLLEAGRLRLIARRIEDAGFDRVTVDLAGYRSGSLNPKE
jgi:pyridinium-3,5-biscarboxylic acid mononucleotide sulfurtransferase